jgi:hypothetical protein
MSARRAYIWGLVALVLGLFVAGAVWRAFNPNASEAPNDDTNVGSRLDGYYLCLHEKDLSPAQMYRLVHRRLPKTDDLALALRGCQEAQKGVNG